VRCCRGRVYSEDENFSIDRGSRLGPKTDSYLVNQAHVASPGYRLIDPLVYSPQGVIFGGPLSAASGTTSTPVPSGSIRTFVIGTDAVPEGLSFAAAPLAVTGSP
jgi:hypothetical protein